MKKNIFDQPVKNDLRTYDKVRKITIGQHYPNFKENYNLIAMDLRCYWGF